MTEFTLKDLQNTPGPATTPEQDIETTRPQTLEELKRVKKIDSGVILADKDENNPFGVTKEQRLKMEAEGPIGFWEGAWRSGGVTTMKNIAFAFAPLELRDALRGRHEQGREYMTGISEAEAMFAVDRFSEDAYEDSDWESAGQKRDIDISTINGFLFKYEESRIRGSSTAGKVGEGIGELPMFMMEFMLTKGAYSTGKQAILGTVKKEVVGAAQKLTKKEILKNIAKKTTDIAVQAAVQTVLSPHRVAKSIAENEIFANMDLTEKGWVMLDEAKQTPFTSYWKGLGDTYIEMFSESTGPAFTPFISKGFNLVKRGGQAVIPRKFVSSKMGEALEGIYLAVKPGARAKDLWSKTGFNGFIEELGEERLGDILRAVTGVDDFGAGEGATILDKIYASFPNKEEMMVEMLVLAAPAGARMTTSAVMRQIENQKLKQGLIDAVPELKDIPKEKMNKLIADIRADQAKEAAEKAPTEQASAVEKKEPVVEKEAPDNTVETLISGTSTVFHGSSKAFEEFDEGKIGTATDQGFLGRGFYFGRTEDIAGEFGKNITQATLDIKNPFDFVGLLDTTGKAEDFVENVIGMFPELEGALDLKSINFLPEHVMADNPNITEAIKAAGFDSVFTADEVVVFSKDQIHRQGKEAEKPKEEPVAKTPEEQQSIIDDRVDFLADQETSVAAQLTDKEKQRDDILKQGKSSLKLDEQISRLDARLNEINQEIVDLQTGKTTEVPLGKQIKDTPRKRLTRLGKKFKEGVKATKTEISETQKGLRDLVNSSVAKEDRAGLLSKIPNVQTQAQFDAIRPKIEASIKKLGEARNQKRMLGKVKRTLKRAGLKKGGKFPKGKFTAEVQDRLNKIIGITKLDAEQSVNRLRKNLEELMDPETSAERRLELQIENELHTMFSDIKNQDSEGLEAVDSMLSQLIATGRDAVADKANRKKASIQKHVDNALGILPEIKSTNSQQTTMMDRLKRNFRSVGKSINGWDDLIDMLSYADKTSKAYQSELSKVASVAAVEQKIKGDVERSLQEVDALIKKVYGLTTNRQVSKKLNEDARVQDLGIIPDSSGQEVRVELTQAQMRKMYMESLDPNIAASVQSEKGGYQMGAIKIHGLSEEMKTKIFAHLTAEDRAFARGQLEIYDKLYDVVNKQHRKDHGANLPKNEFYSPIRRVLSESKEKDVFLEEHSYRRNINPKFIKNRTQNFEMLRIQSDMDVLAAYIAEAHHYVNFTDKIKELRAIFENSDVRANIKVHFGENMVGVIDGFIQRFADRGRMNANGIETLASRLRINYTLSALGGIPGVNIALSLKQQASVLAYADGIPTHKFISGYLSYWKNPIENWKTLNEVSDLFKTRGANMERDLRDAAKSKELSAFKRSKSFQDLILFNIKFGDKLAIANGGWAVYQHHLNKPGGSKAEAIREFEAATQRSQQSSDLSQLSEWQAGSEWGKWFTMFTSSQNQYLRKEMGAMRNLLAGRLTRKEFVKKMAIYHFALPMFFQLISDFGQWQSDDEDDIIPISDELKRAATLGSLNGIFILGDILEGLIGMAMNSYADSDLDTFTNRAVSSPVLDTSLDIYRMAENIMDDKDSFADFDSAMKDLNAPADVIGSLTGLPLKKALTLIEGTYDIMEEDVTAGALKWAGWSPYSVRKNLEEDKGPRKKKTERKKKTRKKRESR